jgi:hypothetical protein
MHNRTRALRVLLSFAVLAYVTAAMITSFTSPAHAQTATEFRLAETERRMSVIEAAQLGERIAKLEAVLETNNKLLVAVLIAIAGMALERIAQLGKGRRSQPEEAE